MALADGVMQIFAATCAVMALLASIFAAGLHWAGVGRMGPVGDAPTTDSRGGVSAQGEAASLSSSGLSPALVFEGALYFGVVAATIETAVLVIRGALAFLELTAGFPVLRAYRFGFGVGGLGTLLALTAACVPALLVFRDGRTLVCLFWSAMLSGGWACLLPQAVHPEPQGGFERSAIALLLGGGIALLMAAGAILADWLDERGDGLGRFGGQHTGERHASAALAPSLMVAGALLILLVAFQLVMPIAGGSADYHYVAVVLATTAFTGSWGCTVLVRRAFHAGVAEVAMALASFGLCALATAAAPPLSRRLSEQYPVLFNAMVVGFAAAAGMWTEWALWWQARAQNGQAVEPAEILVPLAKRTAFVSASLALLIAVIMAVWPRWPAIATMDHSLGRVTAGFSANLFLLLILLRSARRFQRLTFHILTVLAVLVTAGFLLVRVLPFTPMFG